MAWLFKMTDNGGGYKAKMHFSCTARSMTMLIYIYICHCVVSRAKRCRICVSNQHEKCPRRAENDGEEIKQKEKACLNMLLHDFSYLLKIQNASVGLMRKERS